jgi:Fur family ferric uptake transcriptional regulator/Fur family peroxide stress response transcriptional regulator
MARLERNKVEIMAQANGLKMTPQRRVIIDYLQNAVNHPTAEEVMIAVNEKFPMTSRATVYNTLNWLRDEGLVQEVFEGGSVRFDPNTDYHHHFICRVCGRVEDVPSEFVGSFNVGSLNNGQMVETLEVTMRGVCAACR